MEDDRIGEEGSCKACLVSLNGLENLPRSFLGSMASAEADELHGSISIEFMSRPCQR